MGNPQSVIPMSTPAKVYNSEAIVAVPIGADFLRRSSEQRPHGIEPRRCAGSWNGSSKIGRDTGRTRFGSAIDEVHQAQQGIHRCLMFPVADERPSCYEERAALKKAQARSVYCQGKMERVRHWQSVMQHELFEYDGRISQLVRILEIDVPQATAVLEKIIRHLEAYQATRAADPKSSYNDWRSPRSIWSEDKTESTNGKETPETDGEHKLAAEGSESPRLIPRRSQVGATMPPKE